MIGAWRWSEIGRNGGRNDGRDADEGGVQLGGWGGIFLNVKGGGSLLLELWLDDSLYAPKFSHFPHYLWLFRHPNRWGDGWGFRHPI